MNFRWFLLVGAALCLIAVVGTALPTPSQAQSSDTVSGMVIDAAGPVAGAVVRVRATAISTTTDADGRFTLTNLSPGEAVNLTAWAPGYYVTGGQAYLPGTQNVVLTLIPHADADNPEYGWLS